MSAVSTQKMILTSKNPDIQTLFNCGKERNEKVAHSGVCSCMRYYVIVHIEDNTQITKCSNDMIYEILSRKLISSCYRLPSCRGEMKEKLYIKRPCSALCLSHFIFFSIMQLWLLLIKETLLSAPLFCLCGNSLKTRFKCDEINSGFVAGRNVFNKAITITYFKGWLVMIK